MFIEKSKKEIKERLIKGAALSDDELEQVSGGATSVVDAATNASSLKPVDFDYGSQARQAKYLEGLNRPINQ